MTDSHLWFDNLKIQVVRKPIKHIYLRINSTDAEVSMSVPLKASLGFIRQQLEKKRDWIRTRRAQGYPTLLQAVTDLESGHALDFLGNRHTLLVVPDGTSNLVKREGNTILLFLCGKDSMVDRQKLLNGWYRQQLQGILQELLLKWNSRIPVRVSGFAIRPMKTRWGSCNTRTGRICMNLNLIKKPLECMEYVLVHEMVHLLEASHNDRFYKLMSQYLPDWKVPHRLLNPNSRR